MGSAMVKSISFIVVLNLVRSCSSLSGHVCHRERAENYETSYNQAFLCQERYTTSCGHLDWRRCTKYRIQTCYTPKQRYATRYRQVEECCPGWREDETGACAIPVCHLACHNGGQCEHNGGVPKCSCLEGYYGERCQKERNHVQGWKIAVICACVILLTILMVVSTFIYKRISKRSKMRKRIIRLPPNFKRGTDGMPEEDQSSSNIGVWTLYRHIQEEQNKNGGGRSRDPHLPPIYPSAPTDCSEF